MWHDIAVQVCFLENLIGVGGGANCDLYRGLFNLSEALRLIVGGKRPMNSVCHYTENLHVWAVKKSTFATNLRKLMREK